MFFKDLVERSAFGVSSYIGDKIGISTSSVRLFFIYTSFIAMGSPIIIYLILAFTINMRKYFRRPKHIVWE